MKNREEILSIICGIDFSYLNEIDYDYDIIEAPDHYERCANYYCRCTTLENFVINNIDSSLFVSTLKTTLGININTFDNDIKKICNELTTEDFEFNTSGGYYGEELDSIYLYKYSKKIIELSNILSIKGYRKAKLIKVVSKIEEKEIENNYILDEYVKNLR